MQTPLTQVLGITISEAHDLLCICVRRTELLVRDC